MERSRGRVLFVRGGAVGDFVLTLPAIRAFRASYPENEIHLLGYPKIAELGVAAGIVDQVHALEDPELAEFFIPRARATRELPLRWSSFFAGFDVVVSYLFDPDEIWLENVKSCGVETFLPGNSKLETHPEAGHAAEQLLTPLNALAVFWDPIECRKPFRFARDPLPREERLVMPVGSGSAMKNWGFSNWVALAAQLQEQFCPQLQLTIPIGEAEEERLPELEGLLKEVGVKAELLLHEPLTELALLLERSIAYVGHDTGLSHLAGAAGCSGIALFGPTSPDVWSPVGQSIQVMQATGGQMANLRVNDVAREVYHLVAPKLFTT